MRRIAAVMALTVIACLSATTAQGATSHNPLGHIDGTFWNIPKYGGDDRTYINGWAADPDLGTTSGLSINIIVDGRLMKVTNTHLPRPDVQRVYPQYGGYTGFNSDVPMSVGNHRACITVGNRGAGVDTSLGCVDTYQDSPAYIVGHIDSIKVTSTKPQTVTFTGWLLDPTDYSSRPLSADILQSGGITAPDTGVTASLPRPDVLRYYPGRNPNSGFVATFTPTGIETPYVAGQPVCLTISTDFDGSIYPVAQAPVCTTFPATAG